MKFGEYEIECYDKVTKKIVNQNAITLSELSNFLDTDITDMQKGDKITITCVKEDKNKMWGKVE